MNRLDLTCFSAAAAYRWLIDCNRVKFVENVYIAYASPWIFLIYLYIYKMFSLCHDLIAGASVWRLSRFLASSPCYKRETGTSILGAPKYTGCLSRILHKIYSLLVTPFHFLFPQFESTTFVLKKKHVIYNIALVNTRFDLLSIEKSIKFTPHTIKLIKIYNAWKI